MHITQQDDELTEIKSGILYKVSVPIYRYYINNDNIVVRKEFDKCDTTKNVILCLSDKIEEFQIICQDFTKYTFTIGGYKFLYLDKMVMISKFDAEHFLKECKKHEKCTENKT